MSELYILDADKKPVPATTEEWGKFYKDPHLKRVAFDEIGDITVSTVFLGIDHQWGDGPPLLFETMIFGGEHDEDQWRYTTWDQAVEGHKQACAIVRSRLAGLRH